MAAMQKLKTTEGPATRWATIGATIFGVCVCDNRKRFEKVSS